MPGIALHRLVASQIAQRWRISRTAPFSLYDRDVVEAFFHGAVAPDMGYFVPGGRWISDLVHRERTGEMARALVGSARSPQELAYAWGWITHLLADVAIHPLINRASAEVAETGGEGGLRPGDDLATHLRVELGLDAHLRGRRGAERPRWLPRSPLGGDLGFVVSALHATYGREFPSRTVVAADRAVGALVPGALGLGDAIACGHRIARRRWRRQDAADGEPGPGRALRPPRWLIALGAVPPSPRLLRGVRTAVRELPSLFQHHFSTDLAHLGCFDLDTGVLQPERGREPLWAAA